MPSGKPTLDYGITKEDLSAGVEASSRFVPSIDSKCSELKLEYETCFNRWYSEKFLQNRFDDECSKIFDKYQECLKVTMLIRYVCNVNTMFYHLESDQGKRY